ncbi:hypothetical protein WT57_25755 [Burkholderia pseudomultivorans]|uniref:Uncharacterized protein n=1 Tax=Burkholderia pseudomultivorans TaxID=1207504 RepID=A0A132EW27_9BURK|nr:hypothetical protein WT57_25755 [Burkholderia pseudomultivorans]
MHDKAARSASSTDAGRLERGGRRARAGMRAPPAQRADVDVTHQAANRLFSVRAVQGRRMRS